MKACLLGSGPPPLAPSKSVGFLGARWEMPNEGESLAVYATAFTATALVEEVSNSA